MGTIVDDNGNGIHGEARRESFVLYDDFGQQFSVELPWEHLPELEYVISQLRMAGEDRGALPKEEAPEGARLRRVLRDVERLLDDASPNNDNVYQASGVIRAALAEGNEASSSPQRKHPERQWLPGELLADRDAVFEHVDLATARPSDGSPEELREDHATIIAEVLLEGSNHHDTCKIAFCNVNFEWRHALGRLIAGLLRHAATPVAVRAESEEDEEC